MSNTESGSGMTRIKQYIKNIIPPHRRASAVEKKPSKGLISLSSSGNFSFKSNTRSRAASDVEPPSLPHMQGKQKKKLAEFFGNPMIVSAKANALLGPGNDRTSPRWQSDLSLQRNMEEKRREYIDSVVDRDVAIEQYRIPPQNDKISEKFINLCGDETMKLMASRHVTNKEDISNKAFKMLGTTELLPDHLKRKFGQDNEEANTTQIIQDSVNALNKRNHK